MSADSGRITGTVRHMSGHVTIETDAILLHADTADYDESTEEVVAHGDVRIQLK